jgi:hypothetical protein
VIPAERLRTLFEPFQGKSAAARQSNGLGLGLFISQQIAAAHGGDLTVESSPAAGTIVTVRLPRTADGEIEQPELPDLPNAVVGTAIANDEELRGSALRYGGVGVR